MLNIEKIKAAALAVKETGGCDSAVLFTDLTMPDSVLELIARLEAAESKQILSASARHFKQMEERLEAAEEKTATLLVGIEAKDAALKLALDGILYHRDAETVRKGIDAGNEALAISPSTKLLEQRDRKRDAKLLMSLARDIYMVPCKWRMLELSRRRESGEWIPGLGD